MRMYKCMKPDMIVSRDKTRETITECYVAARRVDGVEPPGDKRADGDRDGVIVATNGRMLIVCSVALEAGDIEGHVAARVIKYARSVSESDDVMMRIGLHRKYARLADGSFMPRSGIKGPCRYPNFEEVIAATKPKQEGGSIGLVAYNPHCMLQLATAMGWFAGNHVAWTCRAPSVDEAAVCRIRGIMGGHSLGVIMPMFLRGGESCNY